MHDLGLDVGARCLGVELEDLVQGSKLARVDVLTQALKLSAQVIGRLRVVASEEFVDQAGDAQAWVDVGGVGVVLDDANGQPNLADRHVGLLPCKQVIDLGGEYGLNCHLLILVGGLQLVADTITTHGVNEVVDLGWVGTTAQDDHLSLWVVDVRDAVEDQLDVVDLDLDEVLHVQVMADWVAERLLAVVKRLELNRHQE